MKKLLLVIVLLPMFSLAQQIVVDGEYIHHEEIIKADSTMSASQLYSKGIEWFATSYKNSKYVIQMQDKEAGIIVGKAGFTVSLPGKGLIPSTEEFVDYTIKLYFKDGRLKYQVSDFTPKSLGTSLKDGKVIKWVSMAKGHSIRYVENIQTACKKEGQVLGLMLKNYFDNLTKTKESW